MYSAFAFPEDHHNDHRRNKRHRHKRDEGVTDESRARNQPLISELSERQVELFSERKYSTAILITG